MKTITRREGEGIVIGDDIIVSVVEICGDMVHLRIECPPEVPIHHSGAFQAIPCEEEAEAME